MATSFSSKQRGPTAAACLVVLQVGASLVSSSGAAELFGDASVNQLVGQEPTGIVVADLNGDDQMDLAVTNRVGNSVSILLGDGLGAFSESSDIDVGAGPEAVAAANFNADGHIDLAVVNRDADSVTILLGDGSGWFSRSSEPLVGAGPVAVVAAELSGDGQIDLAVVNRDSDSVSILLGVGGGDFSPGADLVVGFAPMAVTAGEFNGDGQADLAVVNHESNSISVLLSNGPGSFQHSEIDVGIGPEAIAAGEFNGDGQLDLAVANHDSDDVSILLWKDAQGQFEVTSVIGVGDGPAAVTVSDFNNDGATDLGVANSSTGSATLGGEGSVTILLGDLAGGFSRTLDISTAQHPPALAAGDFNRDGASDLALVNPDSDSVGVLLGNGLGAFSQTPGFFVTEQDADGDAVNVHNLPRSLALGEFNGDGILDLAVGNGVDIFEGSVDILAGDGLGGFLFDPEENIDLGTGSISIAVGNLDGNGLNDLVFGNVNAGTVTVLLGDESGFSQLTPIDVSAPSFFAFADFNADGAQDLAVVSGVGKVFILLGDGQGNFSVSPAIDVGTIPRYAAVGDFDGDGAADLAVANFLSDTVSILLGYGDGSFEPANDLAVGDGPFSVAVGDFNADDKADLAVANQNSNTVSIFLELEQGSPSFTDFDVGRGPSYVAAGDFNNDGADDLIVANGLSDSVSVLMANGQGGFLRIPDIEVGDQPVSIVVSDFDTDGGLDAVVANIDSDSISTLHNRLSDRADVNGSNRIDGFDVAAIGRLCSLVSTDPGYKRNVDVDLNGVIDGDDLAFVGVRFGELRKVGSPLRATVLNPLPPDPDTVTFQQFSAEGDLLTVQILVNDSGYSVSRADFAVTYEPADGDPGQVLELLDGFTPGSYLVGDWGQKFVFDRTTPGAVAVNAYRIPEQDAVGSGQQSLMNLAFRALREGAATLDFGPVQHSQATLLNAAGGEVSGVSFLGPVSVDVQATGEDPIAERIGVVPARLDFGALSVGTAYSRTMRISNFGFSDVEVMGVTSTVPDFTSFVDAPFTISRFGFVELTVQYSAGRAGLFAGELLIEISGSGDGNVRVPVLGRAGLELTAVPSHLDFGGIVVGDARTEYVLLTNTGATPLNLLSVVSERQEFEALVNFSVLPPAQSTLMKIRFEPLSTGEVHGLLQLNFEALGESTAVLSLSGKGL